MSQHADTIIKILTVADKTIKPITSVASILYDDHKIRTIARIPKETADIAEAILDLFR